MQNNWSPNLAEGNKINVCSLKYDGHIHRQWLATVSRVEPPLIMLKGVFDTEVNHPLLGRIQAGTLSLEYYWTERWYNVFKFLEPDGGFRNYYCNINMPPAFDGDTLRFVDLDIDVLVFKDKSFRILDEDEFTENAKKFGYPDEVASGAFEGLNQLITHIQSGQDPFN
jgi:protein associated with RNAse G/E